jgi:hypothetical protein
MKHTQACAQVCVHKCTHTHTHIHTHTHTHTHTHEHMHTHQDSTAGSIASKDTALGWRDGSEVKSTDCSSKGPEFKSQQPHGGSQPSVMRSSGVSEDSYSVLTYNK